MSTSTIQLCPHLTVDLNSQIKSNQCKGILLQVVAVVSATALLIIFGSATAISLALLTPPPTWILLISLVATFGAMQGINCWRQGSELFAENATLKQIGAEVAAISHWEAAEIQQYFTEQGLDIETVTGHDRIINKLRELQPQAPLKALIPLIARERLLARDFSAKISAKEHLQDVHKQNSPLVKRMYFDKGMLDREKAALHSFQRAMLLQNILMPTCTISFYKDEHEFLLIVDGAIYGKILEKQPEDRAIEYVSIPPFIAETPHYFYHPLTNQPAVTIETLFASEPKEIRTLIFGSDSIS